MTVAPITPPITSPAPPADTSEAPPITVTRTEYIGQRSMHLLRDAEALWCDPLPWLSLLQFAAVTGDWRPRGTDAPEQLVTGGHLSGALAKGHYWPMGQTLAASDARALAEGIRRAFTRWVKPHGPNGPRFAINDPRLCERVQFAGAEVAVWNAVESFDLDDHDAELLAAFLERGACRLLWGPPEAIERNAQRAAQRRARRVPLEAERDRLILAVQRGTITDAEAAPRLAGLREALARVDDELPPNAA